ncbi:MAG TPA: DUF3014 domain-containing protein [Burkholderiaceae bacterium]|nr:DUF3014 domain-containing protein [Burkholderiaceae bacterium]
MTKKAVIGAGVAIVIAIAAVLLWRQQRSEAPQPASAQAPSAVVALPAAPPASAPASAPAGPLHPIEAASIAASGPVLAPASVEDALVELLGRKQVLSALQIDDFPRRFAATVDNLGRASASPRLWPVNPTPGRFTTRTHGDVTTISADNGQRYLPFVLLVESVDMRRAVATYVRLYPLIQKAYEELGFPGRHFNDRLVEVIDLLLATPEIEAPLKVALPTISGPVLPDRPWVLYEFDAPELKALAAGQKILLRMGPVNERRLKAKLAEIRGLVAKAQPPR